MSNEQFKQVSLDLILADPNQPRKTFSVSGIEELASSIRMRGLMQPINLRQLSDEEKSDESIVGAENLFTEKKYMIVSGERRYRAFLLNRDSHNGRKTVPAIIRQYSDLESVKEGQLIENIQREQVNPMEEAEAILYLSKKYNADEIASRIAQSTAFVKQRLKLNSLIPSFKEKIISELMTLSSGLLIADLTIADQENIWNSLSIGNDGIVSSKQIKSFVDKEKRFLYKANWCLEDESVIANAPACINCAHNSLNRGFNLFTDEKPSCSKLSCFMSKKQTSFKNFLSDRKRDNALVVCDSYFTVTEHWLDDDKKAIIEIFKNNSFKVLTKEHVRTFPVEQRVYSKEEFIQHNKWRFSIGTEDQESEEVINDAYQEYLVETQDEEQRILDLHSSGKLDDGWLLNIRDYSVTKVYIEHKKEESSEKKKMSELPPLGQIKRIEEREVRKKEIAAVKQFQEVLSLSVPITDAQLTKAERLSFIASCVYRYGSYQDAGKFKTLHNNRDCGHVNYYERYMLKWDDDTIEKVSNYFMRKIMRENLSTWVEASHKNITANRAYYDVIKEAFPEEVFSIEVLYKEKEEKREFRNAERINKLKAMVEEE